MSRLPLAFELFALAPFLALAGCAITPAELGPNDFSDTRTVELTVPTVNAVSAFYEGIRLCDSHRGVKCGPQRSDGSAVCDVYEAAVFWANPLVLGRAYFDAAAGGGTRATFAVAKRYASGRADRASLLNRTFDDWSRFASGKAACQ